MQSIRPLSPPSPTPVPNALPRLETPPRSPPTSSSPPRRPLSRGPNTPLLRTPMSKGSDHDSTNRGHSQGLAVEDIHPGIARDLNQHQASCAVDKMLTYFLESILAPDEEHDAVSLFSDVRDAAVPIANELREKVEIYCELVEKETDRYAPFVGLVNGILQKTENLHKKLKKYTFLTAHLGLLAHRNADKPIVGHYDDAKTKIAPDVVLTSLSAALRVSDDIMASWIEISTSPAVEESPHLNFVWPDVLGSLEFKLQAYGLPPPPELYTSEGYVDIPAVADYAAETLPTSPITAHRPKRSQPSKGPVTPFLSTSSHIMKSRRQAKTDLAFNSLPLHHAVMERSPSSEPPQRPRKRGPPIVQTAMYAAERLGAGFASLHVINILIADGVFWIWYYDREGCVQTTGIDFTQDLPRLIVLLFAFQRFGLKHWGFHPDLDVLAHKIHGPLSPELSEKIQEFLTEDAPASGNSDFSINATIHLDDAKSVRLDFRTRRPIHQRHGLCGRATQVFSVSEIYKTALHDLPVEAEGFILKAYWPDVARFAEHRIIEAAYSACSPDPDVVNHLPYVFGSRDDEAFNTALIRTALAITPSSPGRVLRLIVFEKLYRLQDQLTSEIGMTMTLQAIKCHYALWTKDIHHTDISLDNIMVRRRTLRLFGIVNDWDLASTPASSRGILERTGTIPFMHPELLTQAYWEGKVPRLYLHDNASFIWVLAFLFLRYNKGKIIDAPTLPLDNLLTNDYEQARMIKKDIIERIFGFASGSDAKKEWAVVVQLLKWTFFEGATRNMNKLSVVDDPEKLAAHLSADAAPDVYNAFWLVLKNAAEMNNLQYIFDMVPGVEGNSSSVAGEGGG